LPDIRLVAIDLDGTLLNPRNRVAEEDAEAVRDALAAGVRVVLATSRWHSAARRTAVALGLAGPIISHNGALVRWIEEGRQLLHHTLDLELSRAIARHVDGLPDDGYVTVGETTYLKTRRLREPARPPASDLVFVDALEPCVSEPPTAFLLFGQQVVRTLVENFRDHHGRELNLAEGFSESFPSYLNVVHALADKGAALGSVCDALGVGVEDTMAIGDAGPDIAMLRVAAIGVAMGNAPAAVKEAADVVAPSNDRAGVAWALRKYVIG
jgi:Cof subfamily protein (haloacid dehalogenase superfamily)